MQGPSPGNPQDPSTAVPFADSAGGLDNLVLRLLAATPGLQPDVSSSVQAWWQRDRSTDESLPDFLIRQGVFSLAAKKKLSLAAKGYVTFSDAESLLADGGVSRLRTGTEQSSAVASAEPARRASSSGIIPAPFLPTAALPQRARTVAASSEPLRPAARRVGPALPVGVPDEDADLGSEGVRLGQYRLIRRVGRGAKGIVYEARDELLGRTVAVKVLDPQLMAAESSGVKRFLLEARAASRLDHPNCVGVHNVGKDAGTVYYAMPLVVGRSAQERLDADGAFSVDEATRICELAARGLDAAHSAGIVHRDVKPGNILLGNDGQVRISDFGMAQAADQFLSGMTEPGRWMGTPHFMSPEQCRGERVDARADIYSLGATYWCLLTGRPPFGGMNPAAVLYKQITDPHPDPRDFVPGIPAACVSVIDRAMAKDPSERFATARDLADALARVRQTDRSMPERDGSQTGPTRGGPSSVPGRRLQPPGVGDRLGKCLLTREIGRGGSGLVFEALHRSLNVQVAVKVLSGAESAREGLRSQLISEARMLARLSHPNIVRVLDVEEEGDFPHIILEYVDGLTLRDLISQGGAMRPARAARVILQTASALAMAAQAGIIHRDVKPGNILLTSDGTAKLADLGLAAFAEALSRPKGVGPDSEAGLTATAMGTPAYMSPEQARGEAAIDHRSDIYSLGATFYHAVTGRPPFEAATYERLMRMHVGEPVIPPRQTDGRSCSRDVGPDRPDACQGSQVPSADVCRPDGRIGTDSPEDRRIGGRSDVGRRHRRPSVPVAVAGEGVPARTKIPGLRELAATGFDFTGPMLQHCPDMASMLAIEAPPHPPRTTPRLLDGLRDETLVQLKPLGVIMRPVPNDLAHAEGAAHNRLVAESHIVGAASDPLGECRIVRISGRNSEIVNTMLFPRRPARLPVFAAELLVFGGVPRLAFIDLQTPGLSPERRAAVAELTRRPAAWFAGLPRDEAPPDWAVKDSAGGYVFTRPGHVRHAEALVEAYRAYLGLWTKLAQSDAVLSPPPPDAAADEALARYKRNHVEHSPGTTYLERIFGGDWTRRFLNRFLYA